MILFFLIALIGGQFIPPATAAASSTNDCQLCHSDIKVQYLKSVHAREEMTCVSCHGGDASTADRNAAHSGTFRSLTDREKIPEECGSCHSSSEKMKPYGLSTDQVALYQTSIHGKKLAQGDTQVAVCTDCHGTHRILGPEDPESQTNPRNIPSTCGSCHADSAKMAAYHISVSVVSDYEASVHGKSWREGNQHAPVCTSCHGTHGAAPPEVGDVSIVCGHCHVTERANFRQSPHKQAMAQAGIPECAGCHSNHRILKTSEKLWDSACIECHDAKSAPLQRGKQIQALLRSSETEIKRADLSIQKAAKIPLDVSDYQARLEEARTYTVEMLPLTHSLNLYEVEDLSRRAKSVSFEIQKEIQGKEKNLRMRRIILILVWFYIMLTIAIIYQFKKYLESRR